MRWKKEDDSLEKELQSYAGKLERALEELELASLLSGEYDQQ